MRKTYRGKQLSTLITQIRSEIGEHAEILATRALASGEHEVDVIERIKQIFVESEQHQTGLAHQLSQQGHSSSFISDALRFMCEGHTLAEYFQSRISFSPSINASCRGVALIGPTGVGKTTTLAKLGAQLKRAYKIKIGFLSADTYRVGAAEHLARYAEMMRAPFQSVNQNATFESCFFQLRSCDTVLIDTPGRSRVEKEQLKELAQMMRKIEGIERYLVLPASGNMADYSRTIESFRSFEFSKTILTKVDETGYMGPVIETLIKEKSPLAFITNGQRVPEDIEPASAVRLSWMVQRVIH